jgi:biotin carboxyl carrier protein
MLLGRPSHRRRVSTTRYDLEHSGQSFVVEVTPEEDGYLITVAGETKKLKLKRGSTPDSYVALLSDKPSEVTIVTVDSKRVELLVNGEHLTFLRPSTAIAPSTPTIATPATSKDVVSSPMPGKVIGTLVTKGENVKNGDPLVILESMKMEIAVRADRDGEVLEILVKDGEPVKRGQGLVKLG